MYTGKLRTLLFILLSFWLTSVSAIDSSFVIKDIKVHGLTSIEPGVVYNALPVRVGDRLTPDKTSAIIHALYASKLFNNIEVSSDGDVLIITVVERKTIGVLDIEGNKEIKKEDLLDGLKSVGLYEGGPYNSMLLSQVQEELQNAYDSQGRYSATITTNVKDLPRNRVKITINIHEGYPAKIKKIIILGNKHYSKKEIISKLNLSKTGLFSWYTQSDVYTREKFRADLEIIKSFYLNRGYVNFQIISSNVALSRNKKNVYITIKIKEGNQYKFGNYKILNNRLIKPKQLNTLVTIKPGKFYSNQSVTETVNNIKSELGDRGYSNAQVAVSENVNNANKTVSLELSITLGHRIYVRQINFIGNKITKADVIRREMRQMEGGWASTKKIRESRTNLMRLGYFETADFQTQPVAGTNNQVDIDVKVKERFSGKFEVGLGYSQIDGLNYKLGVTQSNFAGTGNLVNFLFNKNTASTVYQFGYTNPYYTPDGVSRGFDLGYQTTNLANVGVVSYIRDNASAAVAYGIPLSKDSRLNASLGFEQDVIKVPNIEQSPQEIVDLICPGQKAGAVDPSCGNKKTFNLGRLNLGWSNVTLNKYVFPTEGASQSLYGSFILPGSNIEYYTINYNGALFIPLYDDKYIFNLHGRAGYGNRYGSTDTFPVFANFYAGGPGSVRGYQANTLGPKGTDPTIPAAEPEPLGGNGLVYGSTELIFPTPMIETNTVRTSVFFDAGNVYAINENPEIPSGPLRFSAGVSLQWLSPIGQLVFSLAKPINKQKYDKTEVFQFNMGGQF